MGCDINPFSVGKVIALLRVERSPELRKNFQKRLRHSPQKSTYLERRKLTSLKQFSIKSRA